MDNLPALPTHDCEVNKILAVLQGEISRVLGVQMVGLYLDGSLARGGFDRASDIDFVAVTEGEVSEALFAELQQMHDQIGLIESPLAREIEGFYVAREAVRRYDPSHKWFPNLERGVGERLKWVEQDHYWTVHRYILREYGVALAGPPPKELIDPVTPDDLRRTMVEALQEWGGYLMHKPELVAQAGYQPYAVLTICRMLYTLQKGDIVAKTEAAAWAQDSLGAAWKPLIEKALVDRLDASGAPTPSEAQATLAFLEYARQYEKVYWHRR
jgi:predicted nucleotidyltransferase